MWYNCLKNSGIGVVESIWPYPSTNFQITFKILSVYIINSYLEYSWFKNSAIWLTESIFDFTQLLIHKPTFMFLESITNYMPKIRSVLHFFLDIAHLRILQSSWLRAFSTVPNSKFTKHFSHFLNFYLHATNQVDS